MAEAEAIQGNYNGKGVLDEVDVKGVTWTRYTAETGTVYMYAKAPCGKTVHMSSTMASRGTMLYP